MRKSPAAERASDQQPERVERRLVLSVAVAVAVSVSCRLTVADAARHPLIGAHRFD